MSLSQILPHSILLAQTLQTSCVESQSAQRTVLRRFGHRANPDIDFHLSEGSSNLSSISQTKHSTKKVNVKTHSITELVNEMGFDVPNFIKMDIEGAEALVFEGMIDLVSKRDFDCKILFETHPNMYDEYDIETPLRKMFSNGFRAKYVVSATVKHPKQFKDRGYTPILDSLHSDRALFENVSDDDIIDFLKPHQKEWHQPKGKYGKIVRYVMLERNCKEINNEE